MPDDDDDEKTSRTRPDSDKDEDDDEEDEVFVDARFPPHEEASRVAESHAQKAEANALFGTGRYSEAIGVYERALAACPVYLDFEVAVLKSNVAACHLKLEDWSAAVEAATRSLEGLDKEREKKSQRREEEERENGEAEEKEDEERAVKVRRIRVKSLLRRARGRTAEGGWASLQGAEEDYKTLLQGDDEQREALPARDRRAAEEQLQALPGRIAAAREREVGEMMGKLKELGNGLLKPFGLSTDNFKMTKDEATGGYSMSFDG